MTSWPVFLIRLLLVTFFLGLTISNSFAQVLPDYVYLEVVDSGGKPVADVSVAVVERIGSGKYSITTDQQGLARFQFGLFTLSKSGFFVFPAFDIANPSYKTPVKIELLKIPKTKAERRVVVREQLKRELLWAAKIGDAAAVRRILKSGVDKNIAMKDLRGVSGFSDFPAIIFAALSGDPATVNEFLKAGVSVRSPTEPVRSVLGFYLQSNAFFRFAPQKETEKAKVLSEFDAVAEKLIAAGAEMNDLYSGGPTALMIASGRGYDSTVKMLLTKRQPVNAQSRGGSTALLEALYYPANADPSRTAVIKQLLDAGANPNLVCRDCESPLMKAVWHGDVEIVKLLLVKRAAVNFKTSNGNTPLKFAEIQESRTGRTEFREIAELLKKAGARPY